MGWERGYYDRVHKVQGRVVREYVGRGRVAELAARTDALERRRRERERAARRAQRAELEAIKEPLNELNDLADLLARAALLAAGYHQHKRGEWRKDVDKTNQKTETAPTKGDDLDSLVQRAEQGDTTALPALRVILKNPQAVELLGGNLARQAQLTLIKKFSGKNLLLKESLTRKLDLLRAELAETHQGPVERLLVERVVACWLHLSQLEYLYGQQDSTTQDVGVYFQRCLSAAQKRYLSALKTLALVRKLALPALAGRLAVPPATRPGLPDLSRNGRADPGRNGVPVLN